MSRLRLTPQSSSSSRLSSIEAGEVIYRKADPGSLMYIIQEGRVELAQGDGENGGGVAVLKKGDFFGEAELIANLPRAATAIALEPTVLLRLDAETLRDMVEERPKIALRIIQRMSHRLQETDQHLHDFMTAEAGRRNEGENRAQSETEDDAGVIAEAVGSGNGSSPEIEEPNATTGSGWVSADSALGQPAPTETSVGSDQGGMPYGDMQISSTDEEAPAPPRRKGARLSLAVAALASIVVVSFLVFGTRSSDPAIAEQRDVPSADLTQAREGASAEKREPVGATLGQLSALDYQPPPIRATTERAITIDDGDGRPDAPPEQINLLERAAERPESRPAASTTPPTKPTPPAVRAESLPTARGIASSDTSTRTAEKLDALSATAPAQKAGDDTGSLASSQTANDSPRASVAPDRISSQKQAEPASNDVAVRSPIASSQRPPRAENTEPAVAAVPPKLIEPPRLKYPKMARRLNKQGIVRIRVRVGVDGRVLEGEALSSLGYGLEEAALEAALEARYEPAKRAGRPVEAWATLDMAFRLK